jgi:hypothetical protein
VEVSSSEDDVIKKSASDDDGDGGASSAEPITPNTIRSNTPRQTNPSVVNQAASTNPPVGRHKRKRPPPVPKRKQALPSVDQVMTQIELPPYCRPHSSLDLITIEIIFGRHFGAFQRISQATGTGPLAGDDIQPQKKMCQPLLKKIHVPR